ncbi:PTS sugar transporter [Paenibacillus septentrionalis]|uniref:PTS sugar transporter n=1 Tax=Paenibacillus septentrionalis TaxID=429342 RepID=A0ABW1V689_9BACL
MKVAIIGSSGGNLFNLGGRQPDKLLGEIIAQCQSAQVHIAAIQFIAASESMDIAKGKTSASMYSYDQETMRIVQSDVMTLADINVLAKDSDQNLAKQIEAGSVDGLIIMSGDPEGVNAASVAAAAAKGIPVVGTGGTSMAHVSAKGANVISTSGTTGTTNRTRAVSFLTALCKHWNIKYMPVIGLQSAGAQADDEKSNNVWKRVNFKGIMQASLPGFIAMALVLALSKIPFLSSLSGVFDLIIGALPVLIAVIAAKQVAELDEVSIVAGVIAGILSTGGGIIGGMIGGILAGILVHYLFIKCVQWRFPMTTVNIVAGGIAGLVSGLLMYFLVSPIALQLGEWIKQLINMTIAFNPILAGIIAGLLIWPAIIAGIYHAAILPIVLLEMESTGNSFLGAVDMVGLVMVSAGITLANIIGPRNKGEAAVATPGFLINVGFGTFVEAAYPFMFSNKVVFAGAIIASGIGGGLVGLFGVRGTAYVPSVAAPFLSDNALGFTAAMLMSLIVAFIFTLIANKTARQATNA